MEPVKIVTLLSETSVEGISNEIENFIAPNETVLVALRSIRDEVVITNKKLYVLDVQGIRGKKKSIQVIPMSKITTFEVESAGTFDLDTELKIYIGNQLYSFELTKNADVFKVGRILSENI